ALDFTWIARLICFLSRFKSHPIADENPPRSEIPPAFRARQIARHSRATHDSEESVAHAVHPLSAVPPTPDTTSHPHHQSYRPQSAARCGRGECGSDAFAPCAEADATA